MTDTDGISTVKLTVFSKHALNVLLLKVRIRFFDPSC